MGYVHEQVFLLFQNQLTVSFLLQLRYRLMVAVRISAPVTMRTGPFRGGKAVTDEPCLPRGQEEGGNP